MKSPPGCLAGPARDEFRPRPAKAITVSKSVCLVFTAKQHEALVYNAKIKHKTLAQYVIAALADSGSFKTNWEL